MEKIKEIKENKTKETYKMLNDDRKPLYKHCKDDNFIYIYTIYILYIVLATHFIFFFSMIPDSRCTVVDSL